MITVRKSPALQTGAAGYPLELSLPLNRYQYEVRPVTGNGYYVVTGNAVKRFLLEFGGIFCGAKRWLEAG